MNQSKFFLKSKTVWGIILTLIALGMNLMGIEMNPADHEELSTKGLAFIEAAQALLGPILVLWGTFSSNRTPLHVLPQ